MKWRWNKVYFCHPPSTTPTSRPPSRAVQRLALCSFLECSLFSHPRSLYSSLCLLSHSSSSLSFSPLPWYINTQFHKSIRLSYLWEVFHLHRHLGPSVIPRWLKHLQTPVVLIRLNRILRDTQKGTLSFFLFFVCMRRPWGCFMSTWNVTANLPEGWSPPQKKPFQQSGSLQRSDRTMHHPTLRRTAEPQSASDAGRLMLSIKSNLWACIMQASGSWSDPWTGIAHLEADAFTNESRWLSLYRVNLWTDSEATCCLSLCSLFF